VVSASFHHATCFEHVYTLLPKLYPSLACMEVVNNSVRLSTPMCY